MTTREHYTHPPIHRAFEVLERLSVDEKTRRLAELREKALRDEEDLLAQAYNEGREQGREEERQALAGRLLDGGMSIEQTAELTGLPLNQVRNLRQPPVRGHE